MLSACGLFVASLISPVAHQLQANQARVSSLTGTIRRHEAFRSEVLGNQRNILVYLPPGYEGSSQRYPVVILHDGQNCFDGATSFIPNQEWRADETAESLIRGGLIQPVIMVAIDNAGAERGNEFLPTQRVPRGGLQPMGGKADLYGKFITDEVLPFINREYRTNPDPQVTGMIGSSLGGIITLHLGLTLGRFTRLGVVSPSVWWDDRMILRTVNGIPTSKRLRVWIDMGTREGNQAVEDARLLRGAFLSRGFQLGSNLAYYEDVGAEHNEKAWAGRFGMILMFLYGKNSP